MQRLSLTCLTLILNSALTIIPAPRNLSVFSVNFHHVLRWEPGPGTALGTQYHIFTRVPGHKRQLSLTTNTSIVLKLENERRYNLSVLASSNQDRSPETSCTFTPYQNTRLGPPILSLTGCGDCLQLAISLPEADNNSGIVDIQKFYSARFRILCKRGKDMVIDYVTKKRNNTLRNLNQGVEYCVQVHIETTLNKNTEPSAWTCVFTSFVKSRKDSVVIGTTAGVLISVLGFLTACVLCLHYLGFLCKLRSLPTSLTILSNGYTLTPEGTTGGIVFIASEGKKLIIDNKQTPVHPVAANNCEEDEDQDEEEAFGNYVDRDAQLSLKQTLWVSSTELTDTVDPSVLENSPSLRGRLDAQHEVKFRYEQKCHDEATEVIPEKVTGEVLHEEIQEEETMMKQSSDMFDSTDNVDLFSVTLAALSAAEEERKEEENTPEPVTTVLVQSTILSTTDKTGDRPSVSSKNDDFRKDQREEEQDQTETSEYRLHREQIEDDEENGEDSNTFSEYVAHR